MLLKMKHIYVVGVAAFLALVSFQAEGVVKADSDNVTKIPSPMYRALVSLIVDHLYDSLTGNLFQLEGTRALQEFALSLTPDDLVSIDPSNKQSMRVVWDNLIDSVNVAFVETPIKKEIRLFIRALIKSIETVDIANIFTTGSVSNFFLKAHAAVDKTFKEIPHKAEFVAMLKLQEQCIVALKDTTASMLTIKVPPPITPKEEL